MPARSVSRGVSKRTITAQAGSNAFHWTMVVCTGGLWFLVWPLFRRKRVVKVRVNRPRRSRV